jgi:hypothetical protein
LFLPVEGEELLAPIHSAHPLVVGLDEGGDVDVGLLVLVPPLDLTCGLDGIVVGAHSHLLVVEPFDNKDTLLRDLRVHSPTPLLLQHLLCLQWALLNAVCPEGASRWQIKFPRIKK